MTESGDHSFSKYQIEAEIGRGGFGTVYRALDTGLERPVALKILDPLLMRDSGWVMSFRKEARVTALLEHPHIVPVYEIGEERERLFIAMKLIEGGSLATHILQKGAMSWEESLRIVQEVASALDFAHGRQVAHRDLKPGNILLGPDGCVLTDFGFARMLGDNSMSLSLSGGVVGTPPYMAPEIWEGRRDAGKQADVYALGCILYEMVTGQVLFNGDTPPAVMLAHFKPLALPATWPAGVPAGLGEILSVALSPEPDTRYAGAGEMAQALGRLATDSLAGPYQALEEALAAGEWETALQIAGSIRAQNTGYRDVRALAEKAAAGRERTQRAAWAGQWQQQAEAALAEGNLAGARTAALQWQKMAPEDEGVKAFLTGFAESDGTIETRFKQLKDRTSGRPVLRASVFIGIGSLSCLALATFIIVLVLGLIPAHGATLQETIGTPTGSITQVAQTLEENPSLQLMTTIQSQQHATNLTIISDMPETATTTPTQTGTPRPTQTASATRTPNATFTMRAGTWAAEAAIATATRQAWDAEAAIATATRQASAIATIQVLRSLLSTLNINSGMTKVFYSESGSFFIFNDGSTQNVAGDSNVQDFIAEATVFNPVALNDGSWQLGFGFRFAGNTGTTGTEFLALHLTAQSPYDPHWSLYRITREPSSPLAEGSVASLNTDINGFNHIRLIVQGTNGWLYINDQFVAKFDLPIQINARGVDLRMGIFEGGPITTNRYENFTVWSIP
jgi:hypothetical protein